MSVSGSAADMVRVAQREANLKDGTNKESPLKSNSVKYNDWFYGKHVSGKSYPWCAAFVSWVANNAGISTNVIPKSASAGAIYRAVGNKGGTYPKLTDAKPGDLAIFTNDGTINTSKHIGIVESASGGKINTIEGNSSDAVSRRSYKNTNKTILLARPAYPSSSVKASKTGLGRNENKLMSKYGQFKSTIYGKGNGQYVSTTEKIKDLNGYRTIEYSGLDKAINAASNIQKPKYGRSTVQSSISPQVIKSIIELLFKIANNTDTLNLMLKLLKEKFDVKITANDIAEAQHGNTTSQKLAAAIANSNSSALSKLNTYADTIENDSIASLIAGLNAIAAE